MIHPPIEKLVPHTPPMRLLDQVVDRSESSITCSLVIRSDSTFVRQGRVRSAVALEYMAQCVAAFAGYAQYHAGKPPKIGYLVSIREAVFDTDYLYVGDELLVRADHCWGSDQAATFRCEVHRAGSAVARATLSVIQRSTGHE